MSEAEVHTTDQKSAPAAARECCTQLLQMQVSGDAICWHRFFGALQLALIVLLFLTGVLMALAYTPVPGTAYDSVDYFQFSLPLGDVVRGVHHYAWNLLLMVVVASSKAPECKGSFGGIVVVLLISFSLLGRWYLWSGAQVLVRSHLVDQLF